MKRLIAALVLIISIAVICTVGIIYVSNTYNDFDGAIKQCKELINDKNYDAAKELSTTTAKRWSKTRGILSIFINHGTVEQIDESISQLSSFANKENTAHFLAECEVLRLNFLEMKEYCGVSLHTLF